MYKESDIINFEVMGGWPMYKMNIREVIEKFGGVFNKETNKWEIQESEKLDVYPIIVNDDGMGYGVNEQYMIDVNLSEYNNEQYCSIFAERSIEYPEIWLRNRVFPGYTFRYEEHDLSFESVDETDNGFVFKTIEYDNESGKVIYTRFFTESELEEIIKKRCENKRFN